MSGNPHRGLPPCGSFHMHSGPCDPDTPPAPVDSIGPVVEHDGTGSAQHPTEREPTSNSDDSAADLYDAAMAYAKQRRLAGPTSDMEGLHAAEEALERAARAFASPTAIGEEGRMAEQVVAALECNNEAAMPRAGSKDLTRYDIANLLRMGALKVVVSGNKDVAGTTGTTGCEGTKEHRYGTTATPGRCPYCGRSVVEAGGDQ